jgi:subfamily B ATP-binding cassette protein MsbA
MSKTTDLTAFRRVWSYVWPQWPRLIAVVFWSALMAGMLSISLVTLIPVLKVMMGEEGLHGWVDRKIVDKRYGMEFYLPERAELYESAESLRYQLEIVGIEADSWAYTAGIRTRDRIVGVSTSPGTPPETFALKMQEILAVRMPDQPLFITIDGADRQIRIVEAVAPEKPFYIDWAQWLVNRVPRNQNEQSKFHSIMLLMIVVTIITIFRCLARFYQQYLGEKIVNIAVTRIREDIFRHVMYMSVGFFSSRGTSDTTSRILGDVAVSGRGIKILLGKAVREPFTVIAVLVLAFLYNAQLTLIFLLSAPLVIGIFAILGKKMKRATKKSLVATASILGRIQGAMNALRVVKIYNRQDFEIDSYEQGNRSLLRQNLKIAKIEAGINPLLDVMGMLFLAAIILFGAAWVSQKKLESSEFFILIGLLGLAAESVRKVSDVWNQIQQANAAAERVFAVIDEPLETEAPDAVELGPLQNEITFEDIVFSYSGAAQPALRGIDLTVPAGQTVAVVGPNGSGKTTLINLLPRFYDPDRGRILIDGRDIREVTLKSLRGQIGMVTQNVVTFHDTIANNIAYSKPGATRDEIINAAKRAYAHEFIEPLPDGYDTVIGENSAGFSGGQLQRIIIARAILRDPRILIFDEAMSQIDADSEAKIHAALSELMQGRTCFLIAHRFSTVISADRIVVIDDGRIVGDGTHETLVKSCPVYRGLYETQLLVPQSDETD